jgi:thiamine biosynthesis lipoprotein
MDLIAQMMPEALRKQNFFSRSRLRRGLGLTLSVTVVLTILFLKSRLPHRQHLQGRAMGCEWTVLTREARVSDDHLHREVARVLEHWEQVMSSWRPDSDLNRYQQGHRASADLQRVLDLAEEMRRVTEGAFDVRVRAAVHRAGFAPAGGEMDLSGLGKGFAVDRVAERLRELGYRDFLVQLAGETIAGDEPWQVALESPDPSARVASQQVTLCRQALATSGNYRQFHRGDDGKIRSHLIDPATGEPVIREWTAVSVIAADAASADAWSTACFVRGMRRAGPGMRVIWQQADTGSDEQAR